MPSNSDPSNVVPANAAQRAFRARTLGNTAQGLGLGPPPPPGAGRMARRVGLGLFGTLASLLWLWSLSPPVP